MDDFSDENSIQDEPEDKNSEINEEEDDDDDEIGVDEKEFEEITENESDLSGGEETENKSDESKVNDLVIFLP